MSDFRHYSPEDVEKDFIALRGEELKRFTRVHDNIAGFLEEARASFETISKKLGGVRSLPAKGGAIVVDPTNRIFSLLQVETSPLGEGDAIVTLVVMKPPIIPHFFLATAYLAIKGNLTPITLVRLSPVLTLVAALGNAPTLTATAANFIISMGLIDEFATHGASVIPFPADALRLPTKAKDSLYLCNMGLSTVPIEGSYNVKVDVSGIPPIDEGVLRSPTFKPLRQILDGLVGV